MFTGIVESLGEVVVIDHAASDARIRIRCEFADSLVFGESVAVNGVCLTVTENTDSEFAADVMPPTLQRTTLGALQPAARVNLERALTPTSRLGGHVVQGHVDGVGTVLSREPGPRWDTVRIGLPAGLSRYVASKGSVAVDGVSLTVVDVTDGEFTVGLIPTTLQATTLGLRQPGDDVNIEVDVMAKYVERLLDARAGQPS